MHIEYKWRLMGFFSYLNIRIRILQVIAEYNTIHTVQYGNNCFVIDWHLSQLSVLSVPEQRCGKRQYHRSHRRSLIIGISHLSYCNK